jgi:hypothetical protein
VKRAGSECWVKEKDPLSIVLPADFREVFSKKNLSDSLTQVLVLSLNLNVAVIWSIDEGV